MQGKITKRTVDAAKPAKGDVLLWDPELKGFGLKVTPAGNKVYIVQTRLSGRGPTRRFTIGRHGSPWTPDSARTKARDILAQTADGIDPVALERAEEEARKRATVEAEHKKERSFSNVAGRYIKRRLQGKDSAKLKESILRRRFLAAWADRDIAAIGRRDIAAVLDAIVDEGHPQAANNALRAIRPLFRYAVERGLITSNPASGLRTDVPEVSRDRVLSGGELREVWNAASELGYPFGTMVQLLAITGQRRNEVAGMRWSELDLKEGVWSIPAERTKNEKAHIVHLCPEAIRLLKAAPQLSKEFVLTTTGRSPISGFSKAKAKLDTKIHEARLKAHIEAGGEPEKVEAMPSWNLHDLRRTMSTGMAQLGIAPHVVEKCLNHVPKALTGVAGIYNRFEYLEERKAALHAWGKQVKATVAGKAAASNVVALSSKRARRPAANA